MRDVLSSTLSNRLGTYIPPNTPRIHPAELDISPLVHHPTHLVAIDFGEDEAGVVTKEQLALLDCAQGSGAAAHNIWNVTFVPLMITKPYDLLQMQRLQ